MALAVQAGHSLQVDFSNSVAGQARSGSRFFGRPTQRTDVGPVLRLGPGGDFTRDFGADPRRPGWVARLSEAGEQVAGRGESSGRGADRAEFSPAATAGWTKAVASEGEESQSGAHRRETLAARLEALEGAQAALASQGTVLDGVLALLEDVMGWLGGVMRVLGSMWGTASNETVPFAWVGAGADGSGKAGRGEHRRSSAGWRRGATPRAWATGSGRATPTQTGSTQA